MRALFKALTLLSVIAALNLCDASVNDVDRHR
jgi:hypothetical protein